MVKEITAAEFENVIKNNQIVVVDFFAPWCGPCRMMHPIIEEVSEEYANIQFVKIDIDDAIEVANQQNIQVVPTIIAYKNGVEFSRIRGYNSKRDFELFVQSLL